MFLCSQSLGLLQLFIHWHHFWSNVPPSENSKSCSQSRFMQKQTWASHSTPLLKKLHWLAVKEMILFKIATFAFHFFNATLPKCLSSCLWVYTPSNTLHSSFDKKTLSCVKYKPKGFGYWSFSVQTPLVCNSLSPHIRHSSSLSQFKTSLKTFLFTSAFSELPWLPRRFEIFPPYRLLMFVCCWFVSEGESDW